MSPKIPKLNSRGSGEVVSVIVPELPVIDTITCAERSERPKKNERNLFNLKSILVSQNVASLLIAFACIAMPSVGAEQPLQLEPVHRVQNNQGRLNAQMASDDKAKRVAPQDIAEVTRELPDHGDSFETMNPIWRFRESLAESGLYTSGSITWDGSKNLRGGLDTGGFRQRRNAVVSTLRIVCGF